MSEQKMTVAALNTKLNDELAALKEVIDGMKEQIEKLEVSNLQLRTELMELRATYKPTSKSANPTEPRQDAAGVYDFIPLTANVTAVSSLSRDKVKLNGEIVVCTPQVWAFWKTQLEKRAKASAREQSQYEEHCA